MNSGLLLIFWSVSSQSRKVFFNYENWKLCDLKLSYNSKMRMTIFYSAIREIAYFSYVMFFCFCFKDLPNTVNNVCICNYSLTPVDIWKKYIYYLHIYNIFISIFGHELSNPYLSEKNRYEKREKNEKKVQRSPVCACLGACIGVQRELVSQSRDSENFKESEKVLSQYVKSHILYM